MAQVISFISSQNIEESVHNKLVQTITNIWVSAQRKVIIEK